MPESKLVFYSVLKDPYGIICKIIEKAFINNKYCLLLCSTKDEVEFFDAKLWSYSKLSFIPHGSKYSIGKDYVAYCYTWISEDLCYDNKPNYLIHLGLSIPTTCLKNFEKIIDVFDNNNIDKAKVRYQSFQIKDYTLWIQMQNGWQEGLFN